ncbi:MAG: 30S ribosomal protein S6 [Candidatus Bipolaricaulota bacterium]
MSVRDYEIVFIVRPDLTDEARAAKSERVHTLIAENGGTVTKTEDWGRRVLAYPIRHYTDGFYVFTEFGMPPESVSTLEGRLNIDEELLRYQIVLRG